MLAKASKLDVVWRRLLLTKFFTKGWGTVDNLKRMCKFGQILSDRSRCKHLVDKTYPVFIDKSETRGECRVLEGHFLSPFAKHMKGIMPKEVETARFQVILPLTWKSEQKPVCIHLAGTGDHGFWRRRTVMARPLLKEYGIASILLENPFYGLRKPKEQSRSSLLNVSDLFVMGGALILETLTLLHWCEKRGYGPLGITGVSMGGHMATLAATNWDKPIALIPCLSWSNATPTFTEGVMSGSIPWKTLASEYIFHTEYEAEILRKLMKCPQHDAYKLGQDFAANFPDSMEELNNVTLKSGPGPSQQKQSEPETISIPSQVESDDSLPAARESELNQHSSLCSVYKSIESIPRQLDKDQNDSIPEARKSSSSSSDIFYTFEMNSSTASDADNEKARKISNHLDGSLHTQSRDGTSNSPLSFSKATGGHSNSDVEPSEKNTFRLNDNQEITGLRTDTCTNQQVKRSGHSRGVDEQMSHLKTSSRVERERRKSSRNQDKSANKIKNNLKLSKEEYEAVRDDALQFMKGVMDAATFVGNFSKPVDPELVLSIVASQDAYIPWYQMPSLQELWPGMEVRHVNSGHVAAILFKQHHFRRAIHDAFQKMERKYKDGVCPEES